MTTIYRGGIHASALSPPPPSRTLGNIVQATFGLSVMNIFYGLTARATLGCFL